MRGFLVAFFLAACGLAASPVFAASRGQAWAQVTLQGSLQPKLLAYLELQPRAAFGPAQLDQVIWRASVGYQVHPTLSLSLGFGWIPAWTEPGLDELGVNEGRVYGQLQWKLAAGALTFQVRARLEQRSLAGQHGLFHRVRLMPRVSWTFLQSPELYAAASNEVFFGLTHRLSGPVGGYDQNRAYVGVGYKPSTAHAVELGYLLQHVRRRTDERVGHTAVLTWNVTL